MEQFRHPTLLGPLCAIGAAFGFTLNDMAVKFLSGDYAVQQITFIRAIVAITLMVVIVQIWAGGIQDFRTKRLRVHIVRGVLVVISNLAFLSSLAVLPIANAMALFFAMPIFVAILAKLILKEEVSALRWLAISIGLVGVIVMIRPATDAFTPVSLLPLAAAFGYAVMQIMTRILGQTDGTISMSFYVQLTFLVLCLVIGMGFGDGRFYQSSHDAALSFFTRAWTMPQGTDLIFLALAGVGTTLGSILITHAYRISDAGLVAPMEYAAMPIAVFWGIVIFGDWPTTVDLAGIALIVGSGLIMLWREGSPVPTISKPNRS